MSNIATLLDRLKHVRKTGQNRYRAQCPVHGGDSLSTLAIEECDDGTILLRCHAYQCPALEIVRAVGMEASDLFGKNLIHCSGRKDRLQWRQDAEHREWAREARTAAREARVVYIAAQDTLNKIPLNDPDIERLRLAVQRLESAERKFNG